MKPEIVTLADKKVVGIHISTTIAENRTAELWRTFMPRRKEIVNAVNADFYSLQFFDPSADFTTFNQFSVFDKWAAVEVSDFEQVPSAMDSCVLHGLYAVFPYKGMPQAVDPTLQYIYGAWLPASAYVLDNRAHFAVMGSKYKNNDPDSEEDLWIPIKSKN
ncbi:GyrI-like domain-containing protein [Flavipsychrobacter stenotrophus]|uniref:GyrI-like domain-containing protein n=1 Tax=Flavipsychrobacter stenotrophus TaxID=2077091 RepID=A0A2S7SZK9_9BACT|nr:GyrI-like domain-containing protein [Flavipsychrobacter stenotrophus]PQJ12144.1 GyrI-like domain-containing protein [Flavipsychrobacter stenotrophus]